MAVLDNQAVWYRENFPADIGLTRGRLLGLTPETLPVPHASAGAPTVGLFATNVDGLYLGYKGDRPYALFRAARPEDVGIQWYDPLDEIEGQVATALKTQRLAEARRIAKRLSGFEALDPRAAELLSRVDAAAPGF